MKFKSEIVTQASGSIGGTTYSHNKGGMYRRARAIPTNPNSAAQQAVRMYLATAAQNWSNVLSAAQRLAWNNYAAATPITDALGDSITISGQNMYIRSYTFAMRAGVTPVAAGPAAAGLTELTGIGLTDSSGDLVLDYVNTNSWAATTGGALLVRTSRVLASGVNYFKGPYRKLASVLGNTATPPTSPYTISTTAFGTGIDANTRVSVMVQAIDATGRLSAPVSVLNDV